MATQRVQEKIRLACETAVRFASCCLDTIIPLGAAVTYCNFAVVGAVVEDGPKQEH